ncbi:hypothetical protein TNCV_3539741 [Trichonephila clavipes]|nr:hypothetical protein TNCV_3539741 [Trichonephila clavipes]
MGGGPPGRSSYRAYGSKCRPRHLTMVQNDVAQSPHVAEQCDVALENQHEGDRPRTLNCCPKTPELTAPLSTPPRRIQQASVDSTL